MSYATFSVKIKVGKARTPSTTPCCVHATHIRRLENRTRSTQATKAHRRDCDRLQSRADGVVFAVISSRDETGSFLQEPSFINQPLGRASRPGGSPEQAAAACLSSVIMSLTTVMISRPSWATLPPRPANKWFCKCIRNGADTDPFTQPRGTATSRGKAGRSTSIRAPEAKAKANHEEWLICLKPQGMRGEQRTRPSPGHKGSAASSVEV